MENLKELFEGFNEAYSPQEQYKDIQKPHVEDYGQEFLNQLS